MTHFCTTKSIKGGHFFLIKDDFFEELYFVYNIHKFLGPVLQKVNLAPQVRHLRDGFNINGMNLVTCASKLKVVRGIPGQLI